MLSIPIIVCFNALITGVFTKLADIANDDGFGVSKKVNILLGVLWGVFGSLVVFGNSYVAAFYLGILLSWIFRHKLDNYAHGIGGALILVSIFFVHPTSFVQLLITGVTFVLFTVFGLLTRHKLLKKNIFTDYNLYSFVFLCALSFFYGVVWIVFFSSIFNVVGYHIIKHWWKAKTNEKIL